MQNRNYMNELILPQEGEYVAFYQGYIAAVADKDIMALYETQIEEVRQLFGHLGEEKSRLAYAPGKWTAKELLGHMTDTDRIFGYRALCIARGETGPLPGFDQDQYLAAAEFNDLPLEQLIRDFELSRIAITSMVRSIDPKHYPRIGNANGNPVSLRAILTMIPGHAHHHLGILRERYLPLFG